jgi:dihydropteroate synthase
MHMEGEPQTMQLKPIQSGAVAEVVKFFGQLKNQLNQAGIDSVRWVLDPGIGFGKTPQQNLALLAQQSALMGLGQPLLVGWSRKSTLGHVTGLDVDQRLVPSVAAALMAVERGARILRVHDVAATKQAMQVWSAVSDMKEDAIA